MHYGCTNVVSRQKVAAMAIFETLDDEPMRGVWRKNWAENCPNTVQKGFRASHTFRHLVHRASHITLVVSSSYSQREAERRKEEDSVEFCD